LQKPARTGSGLSPFHILGRVRASVRKARFPSPVPSSLPPGSPPSLEPRPLPGGSPYPCHPSRRASMRRWRASFPWRNRQVGGDWRHGDQADDRDGRQMRHAPMGGRGGTTRRVPTGNCLLGPVARVRPSISSAGHPPPSRTPRPYSLPGEYPSRPCQAGNPHVSSRRASRAVRSL